MEEKNEKITGELKINIKKSEKLENFWYYYKWHTIIGAFVLVFAVILTLQFCTKEEYDLHILYAGEKNISSASLSGDGDSEYSLLVSALESASGKTENGENVNISLQVLRVLSESQLEEVTKDMNSSMDKSAFESGIAENYSQLHNYIMYGDYYLLLLSEDMFLAFDKKLDGESIFAPISQYTKSGTDYEYINERGIYLSSLEIYSEPAVSVLPANTVVCIRLSGVSGTRDNGKGYAKAEEALREILEYKE